MTYVIPVEFIIQENLNTCLMISTNIKKSKTGLRMINKKKKLRLISTLEIVTFQKGQRPLRVIGYKCILDRFKFKFKRFFLTQIILSI